MTTLILQMNSILSDWCKQYDPLRALPLSFTMNERGEVFLSQRRLLLSPNLVLTEARYDAEYIRFSFNNNRYLEISIHWPEDAPQRLEGILWGYELTD